MRQLLHRPCFWLVVKRMTCLAGRGAVWWKTISTGSNFKFLASVTKDERGSGDTAPEKLSPPSLFLRATTCFSLTRMWHGAISCVSSSCPRIWRLSFQYPSKLFLWSKWVEIPEEVHSWNTCIKMIGVHVETSTALFLFVLWPLAYLSRWRKLHVPCPSSPSVQHVRMGYYYIKPTEPHTEDIVTAAQTAVMPSGWHLECWTGKTVLDGNLKLIWSLRKAAEVLPGDEDNIVCFTYVETFKRICGN